MNIFKPVSIEKAPLIMKWMLFFWWALFVLPVVILLYKYKGLTIGDFFLIQGMFRVFSFFLEIPTGYIGDLFSRKKVIVISTLLFLIGTLIWLKFSGFFFIFLGELFFAFSAALYSGTGQAYLYDILKKQGKEKDMTKELGKVRAYTMYGTAFATFSGGFIYKTFGADATIILEAIFMLIAVILSLYLPQILEVKRKVEKGKSKWKDILEISKYAYTHHEIKWLMTFPAIFGAGTLLLMWFQQPLMENRMLSVTLFGVFIGLNQLFRAILSQNSHHIFNKLKTKAFSILTFVILFIGMLTAYIIPNIENKYIIYFMLIVVGFATASQALLSVVMSSMINHRIKSDERATVLSVSAMFGSAFCAIVMISLKFLIDSLGLQTTIAVIGPIILILTFISMVKLLKLKL